MIRICSKYFFSEASIYLKELKLLSSDSNNFEFNFTTIDKYGGIKPESVKIARTGTLADLALGLEQKANLKDLKFFCNLRYPLLESTPLQPFLNRYFYLFHPKMGRILIEGEQFKSTKSEEVVDGLETLELPAVTKREVNNYFQRVNKWLKFKANLTKNKQQLSITVKEAAEVLSEAVIDPVPQERQIQAVQKRWEEIYWKINELQKKKKQADQVCVRRVKKRMSWGLALLAANIGGIWSGTYIFYSWDIIEPIAYFVSSFGGIVLASQFLKIGKPYSNYAYQNYLIQKFTPAVYKELNFDDVELKKHEIELLQLQSILKDYYLRRM